LKKNTKTYLLLGLVLLIWGIIGYKIVNAISKEPEVPILEPSQVVITKKARKKDTFGLMANYRDPFLGTLPTVKKKKVVQPVDKKRQIPKKEIVYSGLVSQSHSDDTMFFVSIEGKQYVMSKGEEINEVTLLKGSELSITVRYDGQSETILLQ